MSDLEQDRAKSRKWNRNFVGVSLIKQGEGFQGWVHCFCSRGPASERGPKRYLQSEMGGGRIAANTGGTQARDRLKEGTPFN